MNTSFGKKTSTAHSHTSKSGFGTIANRFKDDTKNSSNLYVNVGPGAYNSHESYIKLSKQPCAVRYNNLSIGKSLAQTGDYHYEGDRLVFQPNYKDPRKKKSTYYH
jgi:hypothetical protein